MTDQMIAWEIEEWIRDYKIMLGEIKRLNRVLNKVDFISTKLTATYGDEAGMPKGSAGVSQAELRKMDRRERRLHKYESIVHYLDNAMEHIEEEKHCIVYDCMMEGMSYNCYCKPP